MHSHLPLEDVRSVRAMPSPGQPLDELPPVKLRPPWLVFLAKHFAPRNHERYLMQGITLTPEELAALQAMPKKRPWWLAFLRRQFHRVFPEPDN
ncbi:MAG TPA: hypothetical protein VJT67_02260 [Longimicrobiaceae bacterium]|nr:hypothetical protein [Longimicrobiaceae bacterium]